MSIFNKNFYPTPESLIKKLLKPYEIANHRYWDYEISGNILEPSAGKGDIAKFIQDKTKTKMFCIELEPELQQILRADGFSVIHSDFLSYEKDMFFDFIIMNPPFDKGEEHLLKAIEIASKTKIACILNAETIRNPFSEKRKQLAFFLKKYNAEIEYVENAFIDAERQTNVEVALIWLDIDKKESFFEFEYIKESEVKTDFDFDFKEFDLQKNDIINNIKIRSEKAKLALIEKIKADAKFNHYFNEFADFGYENVENWVIKDTPEKIYSHFSVLSKSYMWQYVLKFLDIKNYMSSSMIKNFDAFVNMVLNNQENIIKDMIIDVFDNLTSFAHANIMPVPKWKTNSAYKINRKIIAPAYIRYGQYSDSNYLKKYGDNFSLEYSDWGRSNLADLDKVMAIISGQGNRYLGIAEALERKFNEIGKVRTGEKYDNVCFSTFFKIKFHKKGTIHLEFLDKKLWEEFNYRACLGKNWLPDDEKRKETSQEQPKQSILQLEFVA